MAVTKIWKINGWIGDCLLYIENPNKTQNPLVIGDPKLKEEEYQSLIDVIEYAEDGNKTVRDTERFVSGVNCDAETARQEMILAKNAFDKNDGICAYHAIQSFAPGEVTPETAHEIGIRLAKEMWGERYQVLVATHLDHEHMLSSFRYNPFIYFKRESDIQGFITNLFANTEDKTKHGGDAFWDKTAKMMLSALMYYVWYECPETEMNFGTVMELILAETVEEGDEAGISATQVLIEELRARSPRHIAVRYFDAEKPAMLPFFSV